MKLVSPACVICFFLATKVKSGLLERGLMPRRAEGRKTEGGKRYFVGPDSGLNKKTDYSRSNQNDKFGQWRAWQNKSSELMLLCLAEVDPPLPSDGLPGDRSCNSVPGASLGRILKVGRMRRGTVSALIAIMRIPSFCLSFRR